MTSNTWLGVSESIKDFFEDAVKKNAWFQLQDTEDEPQYREPYVGLQNLPHKNFTPPEWFQPETSKPYHAPYILIQTHNLRISGEEATLGVRAVFGVYSSGVNYAEDVTLNVPDNKAYIDLMNIIQKAITEINNVKSFGGAMLNEDTGITADTYETDTPTWPYAYGYVEFDVDYFTTSSSNYNL